MPEADINNLTAKKKLKDLKLKIYRGKSMG